MNNLEKSVLRRIGENVSSPDAFSDITPIRDSINAAIQDICALTGSYRRTYLLGLVAEKQFYRLSPMLDYIGYVVGVWDRARQSKLSKTDPLQLSRADTDWMEGNGSPERYIQIGTDVIGIYRIPSSSGDVLELDCVAIPKPYTSDTSPIAIRQQFESACVSLAVSEYFASRGDANRAGEHFEKYLETAGLMWMHPKEHERLFSIGQVNAGEAKWPYRNR